MIQIEHYQKVVPPKSHMINMEPSNPKTARLHGLGIALLRKEYHLCCHQKKMAASLGIQRENNNQKEKSHLVFGGFSPFEKYARQNRNLPQVGVKIPKIFDLPHLVYGRQYSHFDCYHGYISW